jgi:hypothetical protein
MLQLSHLKVIVVLSQTGAKQPSELVNTSMASHKAADYFTLCRSPASKRTRGQAGRVSSPTALHSSAASRLVEQMNE